MRQMAFAVNLALLGIPLWAAQTDIRNARLTSAAALPDLQQKVNDAVHAGRPTWIGYEVETVAAHRNSNNGCGDVHYLESGHEQTSSGQPASTAILLRAENRSITRIDVVSAECRIDAQGASVIWLTGVDGDQSVRLLSRLALNGAARKVADSALHAVAIHSAASATKALNDVAASNHDEHSKEQAAFWLGVQRGHDGFLALKELSKDRDAEFRKKLTFDFSQNSDPAAVDELIRLARNDEASEVRGQALFWLAQKAGRKQAATITDIAVNDPDTAVKKKAVFALTQLPQDESFQQLVKVAETNRDPAVRKDAIFWLGQSKDRRALEYLERVIKR
jgi:hypothetical protein